MSENSDVKEVLDELIKKIKLAEKKVDQGENANVYKKLIEDALATLRPYGFINLSEVEKIKNALYARIELEQSTPTDEANENKEEDKFKELKDWIKDAALVYDIVLEWS